MRNRRVVITGIGVISPAGNTVNEFWKNVISGKSMIHKSLEFDNSNFSTTLIGQVTDFDVKNQIKNKKLRKMLQRGEMFAIAASGNAIRDSRIIDYDEYRMGLYLGCTKEFGKYELVEDAFDEAMNEEGVIDSTLFGKKASDTIPPLIILESIPNACIEYISEIHNIKGSNTHFMTTGVSSTQAIGTAFYSISNGDCDYALSGGFDSLSDILSYATFNSVELMTSDKEDFHGPFDKYRNGFVLGEGSGMLLLEEYEHAKNRNAEIYAEIVGYASNAEAKNLVGLEESGNSLEKCIVDALNNAGISNKDVNYINSYASGTVVGDLSEARAINAVFNNNPNVQVSSIKGAIGHLIGASGGVETIATALAVKNDVIPPTASLTTKDENCKINHVIGRCIDQKVECAIKISRGMGGQNAVLVLKKVV